MDDVEGLARGTDREVADWRTTLNNHTDLLNAIREDQVDQGKKLARLEAKVEAELADVRSEMRNGFGKLAKGLELLTGLLTRHLGRPDEEPRGGGPGE